MHPKKLGLGNKKIGMDYASEKIPSFISGLNPDKTGG
jgi:hypothetical protein